MNPKYPVYIVSKGRYETRLTSKALEKMNVPYRIVIEPQEYDNYAAVIDQEKILVLPFSNLGQGSIPARNWIWEHAISENHERHWILDDNIRWFARVHLNKKIKISNGICFKVTEDFTERYTNVVLSGLQYEMFVPAFKKAYPFTLNTRIYSCILIKNDLEFRWRGKYNEDTDLSLRVLKQGFCTILINAFVCKKMTTLKMKGGNTDELYKGTEEGNIRNDGRYLMAESLYKQHPDIVKIVRKWGRWQHQVDYRPFKRNKLIKKQGIEIPQGINNYGMVLRNL